MVDSLDNSGFTRRQLLLGTVACGLAIAAGVPLVERFQRKPLYASAFIAKVTGYDSDIASVIASALKELGMTAEEVKGKRILLKPNLVETALEAPHINTHPLVMRGAVEAFLRLGARRVLVAEGPGHRRDTLQVLEESGLGETLREDKIPFVDLNYEIGENLPNAGRWTRLKTLTFPLMFKEVDWIVSMAKMKTHHWAGVTLSMKNLFGVMPGIYYGWPKNLLHQAGLENSILDINATLKPHFAIVDGIIGMEGDGPIMGTPVNSGVLVIGRNLPAVDATCCRIMGIDPRKITYLAKAENRLGPIDASAVMQVGEEISSVRRNFQLIDDIPAQQGLRLI
jgi:uncharacterized protein (DUF362 family)